MKTRILKYTLELQHEQAIEMGEDSDILSIQSQNGLITFWATQGDLRVPELRYFFIFATGETFDTGGLEYVGTVQVGEFVWHVFEEVEYD